MADKPLNPDKPTPSKPARRRNQPLSRAVAKPDKRWRLPALPPVPPWVWGGAARIGMWGLLIAALGLGLHTLEPIAERAYAGQPVRVEWKELPPWLATDAPALLTLAETYTGVAENTDLRDPALCRVVAENLKQCPYIAEVRRVSKQANGLITVDAQFRKPFTYIVWRETAYLVDESGVVLPDRTAAADLHWSNGLLLTGAATGPPEVGQVWQGEDVAAGLKLIRYMQLRAPDALMRYLRAVNVANWDLRLDPPAGRLQIQTVHRNSPIRWGLPPGEEYTVEASASEKLEKLCAQFAAHNQLPDNGAIDVRPKDEIWQATRPPVP